MHASSDPRSARVLLVVGGGYFDFVGVVVIHRRSCLIQFEFATIHSVKTCEIRSSILPVHFMYEFAKVFLQCFSIIPFIFYYFQASIQISKCQSYTNRFWLPSILFHAHNSASFVSTDSSRLI